MDIHEAVKLLDMSWKEVIDETSIKRAWKKKVRCAHPDKSSQQNATQITQKLNEAKDTMLNSLDDIHRIQRGNNSFDSRLQSWIHAMEMQILAYQRDIREQTERMARMKKEQTERMARELKEQTERMARMKKKQTERMARELKEQAEQMAREKKEQEEQLAREKKIYEERIAREKKLQEERRMAHEKKEQEERELQQKQKEARASARRADLEARLKAEKEKKRLRDEAEPNSKPKQRRRRIPAEETRAHRTTEGYKQAKDLVKEIQHFVSSDTFVSAPGNRLFVKDLMKLFIQNRLNSDTVAMTTLETHLFQRHCKRLFLAAWPTAVYWMYNNQRCFLNVQAKPIN